MDGGVSVVNGAQGDGPSFSVGAVVRGLPWTNGGGDTANFPALFPPHFVLLSIFQITRGNLACFQKAHGQAADHQGGKAPEQGCANARRATKFELNTTVFCSPFGL